jgi:hypothetical protein
LGARQAMRGNYMNQIVFGLFIAHVVDQAMRRKEL